MAFLDFLSSKVLETMNRLIKNNVLPGTFGSVTVLFLASMDMGVKSLSALWHTDLWLLYVLVLTMNGVLFMYGDNQTANKIAGLLLLGVVLFPISSIEQLHPSVWTASDWLHHLFAIGFFIVKPLNHRKYDILIIIIGAASLIGLGLSVYKVEIIGLYVLIYTGYLKKKHYFRKTRTYLNENRNK